MVAQSVSVWGRRYVIYEGRLYRRATLVIHFESPLFTGIVLTWNWVEKWFDECPEWYVSLCPSVGETVSQKLADITSDLIRRWEVKITVGVECEYLKEDNPVITIGEYYVRTSLADIVAIRGGVEIYEYVLGLEDVEGGARGAKYPNITIADLSVRSEDIAKMAIATFGEEAMRLAHERHMELLLVKDPTGNLVIAAEKGECNSSIVDVEVVEVGETAEVRVEEEGLPEVIHPWYRKRKGRKKSGRR